MIKRVKLSIEHLMELLSEPGVKHFGEVRNEYSVNIEKMTDCYSLIDAYGRILCCCGLIPSGENEMEAWTIFRPNLGNSLVSVARHISDFLKSHTCPKIISYIRDDFKKGHKWMTMLGFTLEAPMPALHREGHDHALYSLVKRRD